MTILEVNSLKKIYTTRFGSNTVEALKNVNFSVDEGEYVAIMGESGSGKTTLLNILAALDKATAGSVRLTGQELSQVKEKEIAVPVNGGRFRSLTVLQHAPQRFIHFFTHWNLSDTALRFGLLYVVACFRAP